MKNKFGVKKVFFTTFLILITMSALNSCKTSKELVTVKEVDIDKYLGTWYEIARLPNSFEKDMKCVTATYSMKDNGKIKVLNKGFKTTKNKFSTAKGVAWVPNSDFPAQLKVSFFWPFAGNYFIIELDDNYNYALVGDPSRKYLWILSRTPELEESIYNELITIANNNGFETETLIKTEQDCEN